MPILYRPGGAVGKALEFNLKGTGFETLTIPLIYFVNFYFYESLKSHSLKVLGKYRVFGSILLCFNGGGGTGEFAFLSLSPHVGLQEYPSKAYAILPPIFDSDPKTSRNPLTKLLTMHMESHLHLRSRVIRLGIVHILRINTRGKRLANYSDYG